MEATISTIQMAASGHVEQQEVAFKYELARKASESEFWIPKTGVGSHMG